MDLYERELSEYREVFKPRSLTQFLGVREWAARPIRAHMETWLHDPGAGARVRSVHVPTDDTLEDFSKRLHEAVHEIASIYDWSISELAEQVASIRADLYFVRIQNAAGDGTIPFAQAGDVLSSIEKLVRAAANRTNNSGASGKGRTSERVKGFLAEDLRMGHTKRGSFIITVAARLNPDSSKTTTAEPQVTAATGESSAEDIEAAADLSVDFSRRVMTTLSRALSVTQRHLAEGNDYLGFDEAVDDGMLAPVVEAINELTTVTNGGGIDMDFQWAPTLPPPREVSDHIEFTPAALSRAEITAERFKRAEADPEIEDLSGFVVALEREEGEAVDSGEIVIQADVKGSIKRVRVELSGTDYEWAIFAHRRHLPFSVTGRLEKSKGRWKLSTPVSVDTTFLQSWQRARIERMGGDAPRQIEPPND